MKLNKYTKLIVAILIIGNFSTKAMAEEKGEDEPDDVKPTILENKDAGVFLFSKVVDSLTGWNIENIEVSSQFETVKSTKRGEFFLKVNPEGIITLKGLGYGEKTIKVSSIKGKQTLTKILELYPNMSFSSNYKNLGYSEKFTDLTSSGRFNDSFSFEAQAKLFNVLIAGNYESHNASLARLDDNKKTISKNQYSNNYMSLKTGYSFEFLKNRLALTGMVKGYLNKINLNDTSLDDDRDTDYLDFGNERTALGAEVELMGRPMENVPWITGLAFAYYPMVSVKQDNSLVKIPNNLNELNFNISTRYDFWGFFTQAKFDYRNIFSDSYNSSFNGFSIGLGYGF